MESSQLKFLKVPFMQEKVKQSSNLHIVGIIDASGSMSSWWKILAEFWNSTVPTQNLYTITFDTTPRVCKTNVLSTRINDHGGGGTLIPEAFKEFDKYINTLPIDDPITAIFISDGQDNHINTLEERMKKLEGNKANRKLNFICLGIQSGFPYFLSMNLRNLYHRGDENIPALYLIEYASDQAFFNKFEGMRNYFFSSGAVKIDPAVNIYPWDELVIDSAYEGAWVILKSDQVTLNETTQVSATKNLGIDDASDIFRGWYQQLQIVKLKDKKQSQEYAKQALYEMTRVIESIEKRMGINILKLAETTKGIDTFYERAKQNYALRTGSKISWYVEEVTRMVSGVEEKNVSEFEAAKKANLGTITGKYQQKILALKTITVSVFQQYIEDFVKQFSQIKKISNDSEVKKLLSQEGFIKSFDFVKNQFDLTEVFPYQGMGLSVKRYEGFDKNPWMIQTKVITKTQIEIPQLIETDYSVKSQKLDDVLFLQHKEFDTVELNAILYLFGEKDEDIVDLLNSNLFQYVMSFIVTLNFDEVYSDSYLALIASVLQNVLQEKKTEQRDVFVKQCLESVTVFYSKSKDYQNFSSRVLENLPKLLTEDKSVPLLKVYIHILLLLHNSIIDLNKAKQLQELVLLEYIGKLIESNGVANLLKPDFPEDEKQNIQTQFLKNLDNYYSLSEFRQDFGQQFENLLKNGQRSVTVAKALLYSNKGYGLNLKFVENYSKQEIGYEIPEILYCYMVRHVEDHKLVYFQQEMNKDIDILKSSVLSHIDQNNIKFVPGYSDIYKTMEESYVKLFKERHFQIVPRTEEWVKIHCAENKLEFSEFKFKADSGLLENACQSPQCPHYMKPQPTTKHFKKHMDNWQGKLPPGFHRFLKSRLELDMTQIKAQAKQKWGKQFPTKFDVTEEFAETYIKDTIQFFKQLNI